MIVLNNLIKISVIIFAALTQSSYGQVGAKSSYHMFKIDSLTALKLARDSGLTSSLYPIQAALLKRTDSTYSWRIVTTTSRDSFNATGRTFWIDANTGKVIENGTWVGHADKSVPSTKK
jgi:hypothetical protein